MCVCVCMAGVSGSNPNPSTGELCCVGLLVQLLRHTERGVVGLIYIYIYTHIYIYIYIYIGLTQSPASVAV